MKESLISESFWTQNNIGVNDVILVAVSGGVDSMVLLHEMYHRFPHILVAHIHHGLRQESDMEAQFVSDYCSSKNIPCFIHYIDPTFWETFQGSMETEARKIRYAFFEKLQLQNSVNWIVTAHHKNDSIETVFMNLLRGTGVAGMKGIPVRRDSYIRPLINLSKRDILNYAIQKEIIWVEDASNQALNFRRNQIRNLLIPVVQQIQPEFEKTISFSAQFMDRQNQVMNDLANRFFNMQVTSYGFVVDLTSVCWLKDPIMTLFVLLRRFGFNLEQTGDIIKLLGESNKKWFSTTHELQLWENQLQISTRWRTYQAWEIKAHGSGDFKRFIQYISKETKRDIWPIDAIIQIRVWNSGDRMEFEAGKHKKVSDFLQEKKVRGIEKESVLIVVYQNKIVSILGYWEHELWKGAPCTLTLQDA